MSEKPEVSGPPRPLTAAASSAAAALMAARELDAAVAAVVEAADGWLIEAEKAPDARDKSKATDLKAAIKRWREKRAAFVTLAP